MMIFALDSNVSLAVLTALSTILISLAFLSYRKRPSYPLPPSPRALPIVGHLHLLGPLIHQSFHKLSLVYGPIVYLKLGNVPCIVASSPEVAKELLRTNELSFSDRKNTMAVERITYDLSFAFAPYGPYWKFIKKLVMSELLGPKSIADFLPLRRNEYDRVLRLLKDKAMASESVNLSEELTTLSNNIIFQMMFSFRSSDAGQMEKARHLVREVTQMFGEFDIADFIWFFKAMDVQGSRKKIELLHKRYDALLEKVISEREEQRSMKKFGALNDDGEFKGKDFLDTLLDAMNDYKCEIRITRLHIKGLILDFITAATDATAISIEWAISELLNNPEILKKSQQEIDRVIGNGRLVQESDLPNLPFTEAVLKETFRLHPPIPMVARKSVEESVISGYRIPAKSLVFVNMWTVGRDPKIWDNPSEFRPSRFLSKEADAVDIRGQHFQILPFGAGRRGCPGMNLSMLEVPTMLASLIHCFDWEVEGGDGRKEKVDMAEGSGLTIFKAKNLLCVPKPRFDLNAVI